MAGSSTLSSSSFSYSSSSSEVYSFTGDVGPALILISCSNSAGVRTSFENIRPSQIITFRARDFVHAKLFLGHIYAHKRADMHVTNNNMIRQIHDI